MWKRPRDMIRLLFGVFLPRVLLEAQLIAHELADAAGPLAAWCRSSERGCGVQARGSAGSARPFRAANRRSRLAGACDARSWAPRCGMSALQMRWCCGCGRDLSALEKVTPPTSRVWISGKWAARAGATAGSWRAAARMAYPVTFPATRGACRLRAQLVSHPQDPAPRQQVQRTPISPAAGVGDPEHMVDAFVREYLIERVEMALDHRALTGYYPRLTLAPGQRFASRRLHRALHGSTGHQGGRARRLDHSLRP